MLPGPSSASSQPACSPSAATNGPYASAVPASGADSPIRTCAPPGADSTCRTSSSTSRVLPMPASPVISSSCGWPADALA